jgi:hypothetical protein
VQHLERHFPIFCDIHAQPQLLELAPRQPSQGRIVVDHEDTAASGQALRLEMGRRDDGGVPLVCRRQRQQQREDAALAQSTSDRESSIEQPGEPLGDAEPEPGATEIARRRAVGLHERLEQARNHFGGHADAAVTDGES